MPLLLYLLLPVQGLQIHSTLMMITILCLISLGFIGVFYSELIMQRFGDGRSHFNTKPGRLVDVGVYARNQHPFFWFLSIYHLGVFLLLSQSYSEALGYWCVLLATSIVYLIYIQERQLLQSRGSQYADYRKLTPFFLWKYRIEQNQTLKVLPQLIWLFGRVFLKWWYRIRVSGIRHIPHDKSFLIVANHESYLDPILFGIHIPFEIHFVTTADVFTNPFMNFLLKGIGTFPMRRHRQDLKSIRTMIRMINEGRTVGIFPEGGRTLDGAPLPILDETIKLIQRCKVPILPIQISGAYEIWPRWAPNRRRAQFKAIINPVIPVSQQSGIHELRTLIEDLIFPKERTFRPTRSRFIVKGLDQYLWACPECQTQASITITSKNTLRCSGCQNEWTMTDQYQLINKQSAESLSLVDWNQRIEAPISSKPLNRSFITDIQVDESPYLHSNIQAYRTDTGILMAGELELILTNKRFILLKANKVAETWDLNTITVFTLDFAHSFSIGVGGVRHTFNLKQDDIRYKWQAYFDTLTGNTAPQLPAK
ncbi:MAG: 1-acyl-sn-glycerol-3-phosphate acyltransferase [Candidatus Marinimicrobia bacterium]|nr:1-acyl-sn-glycerol-3-phosphate acyltransferase [Candidatus Neomarinimicrobiota bacterium]